MKGRRISRREFIKVAAGGLVGGIVLYKGLPSLRSNSASAEVAPQVDLSEYNWEEHYWGFVVDIERCIGCGRCVLACKLENNVPMEPEYNRTWVERYVVSEEGKIFVDSPKAGIEGFADDYKNVKYQNLKISKSFFVPKLCNQCDHPPCVQVCPVGATYKTKDGVVLIDQEHCIGCGYCIQACPYGARFLLPDFAATHFGQVRVADKCTWCYHRITKGLRPACVDVCPVGARIFGDLRDPESAVRRVLREKSVNVLKPDLGTKPKVYYIGLEQGVR